MHARLPLNQQYFPLVLLEKTAKKINNNVVRQHLTALVPESRPIRYDIRHIYCVRIRLHSAVKPVALALVLLCTSIGHTSTKGMPPAPPLLIIPYVRHFVRFCTFLQC